MKDLTIVVYDYALNNFNLELNHYFAQNFEMFKSIESKLDVVVVAPNHDKYEFNPQNIEHLDLRTNNETLNLTLETINSKYILLMDSQDVFSEDLTEILDFISTQTADLVFTQLDYDANPLINISVNKAEHRIFGLENYKNIDKDKWMLNLKGLFIKTELIKGLSKIDQINAISSRMVFNQLLLSNPVIEYRQKVVVCERVIVPTELDFEAKFMHCIRDYQEIIVGYYNYLSQDVLNLIAEQLLSDLDYLNKIAKLNSRVNLKKYRKFIQRLQKKHYNEWTKELGTFKKLELASQFKTRRINFINQQKFYTLLQLAFKFLPKKENKLVLINESGKFSGELKYYIRDLVQNKTENEIYFNTNQMIKGLNNFSPKPSIKYYYHLHSASEIIYFDFYPDNFIKSEKQEVSEIYNSIAPLDYPIAQINYANLHETVQINQAKQYLTNVDQIICANKYQENKFKQKLNVPIRVEALKSELFLKQHLNDYELINKLKNKYKLQANKDYILYPIMEVNYKQYINVAQINKKLKANEVLIFVPLTKKYSLTNINRQAYILCDDNVDVYEIALLSDGICNNESSLVDLYRANYRRVIDIDFNTNLIENLIGKL